MSNLAAKFSSILRYYDEVTKFSGEHSSSEFKSLINTACSECETAIRHLNELDIFSHNETLDDLSSEQIKYMIIPAVAGHLIAHKNCNRNTNVKIAMTLFSEFLRLCESYEISKLCHTAQENGSREISAAVRREDKIKKYKQKKAIEQRLETLADYANQPHVDDEVKREYHLELVRKWICIAEEELPTLKLESELLDLREAEQKGTVDSEPKANGQRDSLPETPRLKPFILTRDAAQAAVFGLGYPSIPTMTLDEFYKSQVELGLLPANGDHNKRPPQSSSGGVRRIDPSDAQRKADEEKAAKDDALNEADDEQYIAQARAWDAYKDENRRGDGNRMNRA